MHESMSIEGVQDFVRTSLGQFSLGDNISTQKMGRRYAMNPRADS
jgi:hypothetical protein